LLAESHGDSSSSWSPYIDLLPDRFDTLMYWTPAELDELQASGVKSKIGKLREDQRFMEEIVPVVRRWPEIFGFQGEDDKKVLEAAHRMGTLIMAYAFDVESEGKEVDKDGYMSEEEETEMEKAMVPLADMLNADGHRCNAHLFYTPTHLSMRTLCPVPSGSELLNDYGPLPRADLLRRYGYTSPTYAIHDVAELSHPAILRLA
ncbi:hypothetical protein BDY21DRAFT_261080, partial [Lineolata rhizophorae]